MVIDKSAVGVSVSVSAAVLFALFGSVTPEGGAMVTELVRVPEAVGETVAVSEKVAVPPTAKSTVALILPVPLAEPQLEPLDAVHVHVALVRVAGKLSATAAPETALGPLLLATMV